MPRRSLLLVLVAGGLVATRFAGPEAQVERENPQNPVASAMLEFTLPLEVYQVNDLAIDSQGNLVISGTTYSAGFPTTPDAARRTCGTEGDAFVMVYSPEGLLRYSTCVGVETTELWTEVAAPSDGSVWVATTTSTWVEPRGGCNHCNDTRVAVWRLVPGLPGSFQYGWLNGAGTQASAADVAAAPDGSVWIMATARSPGIQLVNPWQPSFGGASDILLAHYARGRPQLQFSTYLGGGGWDTGLSLGIASDGDAVLTGWSNSLDFPLVRPALRDSASHRVLMRVDESGRFLEYSTYLSPIEYSRMAVDRQGNAFIVGHAVETTPPPPASPGVANRYRDLFLQVVDGAGRECACSRVETGLERIPASDTYARVFAIAGRPSGSLTVVGSYFTDDLISGSYFVTVIDPDGTAKRDPLVVGRPVSDAEFVEAAATRGLEAYVVSHGFVIEPLSRRVTRLRLHPVLSESEEPLGRHRR